MKFASPKQTGLKILRQLICTKNDKHHAIERLAEAYRIYGHLAARLNPLETYDPSFRSEGKFIELDPELYDLQNDLDTNVSEQFEISMGSPKSSTTLAQPIDRWKKTYCGPIAAEFEHLKTLEERKWFAKRFEYYVHADVNRSEKTVIAKQILECQNFDHFVAKKFATVKRYGGEGAEAMIPFFYKLFQESCERFSYDQIVVCMPHRGRLNLLTNLLHFPPAAIFQKMQGKPEFPETVRGSGDVLSHLSTSVDLQYGSRSLHVMLLPNPSHLEAINPVALGKTYARQQSSGQNVFCLQVHGDASLVGQGVIAECLAMSKVPMFSIDGSIHLVVNNQIGFTTEAKLGRSTTYCTDIAKSASCPVIHVNGDYPELAYKAAQLAIEYKDRFKNDVFVDLVCFRRWGHNELDDPTFTQPLMYDIIHSRPSVPDKYVNDLEAQKIINASDRASWLEAHNNYLVAQLKDANTYIPKASHLAKDWSSMIQSPDKVQETWDTGFNAEILMKIGLHSVAAPTDFNIHPHLKKNHCEARVKKLRQGADLDWATCEALAIGSLLYQGYNARISGQDVARGTFSHRHCVLVDRTTGQCCIPLNHLPYDNAGHFEVVNSILSEFGVVGFEYGVSIENPSCLTIWEAQFGDFFNGAQIVFDTCIFSGEGKWLFQSGLVILLPHGHDGAGPEHSSCRLERFLQLSDSKESRMDGEDVNCNIVNPTTAAQYFHVLRRQMVRNYRKPLVVVAPKILLRMPAACSSLVDVQPGTHFIPVLDDPSVKDKGKIRKIILCSGKHYYALAKYKQSRKMTDCAIVRLDGLVPFPIHLIKDCLYAYPNATDFIYSQEESRNMGAWLFVQQRLKNLLGLQLRYAGRPESAIVATAIAEHHHVEHDKVIFDTFTT